MINTLAVLTDEKMTEQFELQKVADVAYKKLNQADKLAIEIAFVEADEIRELNKETRNIDAVTDVLSYPYFDGIRHKVISAKEHKSDMDKATGMLLIGSVCICLDRAKEQAEEYGHSLEREVCYLALHGILHCFGYDHIKPSDEKEMTELAEGIMQEVGVTR